MSCSFGENSGSSLSEHKSHKVGQLCKIYPTNEPLLYTPQCFEQMLYGKELRKKMTPQKHENILQEILMCSRV